MATTIAVIAAGAMGSAVSRRLVQRGCTVLTNLEGRSESTRRRAIEAGMKEATYNSIAREASIILSILPPSDAFSFAQSFAKEANMVSSKILFADCNAVNPETVKSISDIFSGTSISFVDAGIIGGPPRDDYDPVFFASSNDAEQLQKFAELSKYGLKVSVLEGDGAGVGAASALKMSYAVRSTRTKFHVSWRYGYISAHAYLFVSTGYYERNDRRAYHDVSWFVIFSASC